jgi:hypothetical protein
MRVSEIQQYYEKEETQDYTDYINPVIDTFFNFIREQSLEDLYAMTTNEVKERQSKEDFVLYYETCYKYFGLPKKYDQTSCRVFSNPMGKGKIVSATFDIEFEKYPGKGASIFNIINEDTIRLQFFTLSLKKHTKVEELHAISRPTMKAILEKDNEQLYALASQAFKENNSYSDLQSLTKDIFELDLSDCRIFNYAISVDDGHEGIVSAFEVNNSSGILQLVHTKMDDNFYLNGLKYIAKR